MPIHDHLHWSLVIICHAGVPAEEDSCTPWILHLDSMTCGNHPHLMPCTSVCGPVLCASTVPCPKTGMLLLANNTVSNFRSQPTYPVYYAAGHHTPKIKKELLAYLTQEWDYKVQRALCLSATSATALIA